MTSYRVYPLDPAGRIAGAPVLVECGTDAEAIVQGRRLAAGNPAEVWSLTRFVWWLPGETVTRLVNAVRETSH